MTRGIITFDLYKTAVSRAMNLPHLADIAPALPTRPVLFIPTFKSPLHSYTISREPSAFSVFSFKLAHLFKQINIS